MLCRRGIFAALGWLLLLLPPLCAQVQVGHETSLNLNGTAAFGYNGSYGDETSSSHSAAVSGRATLNGNYHSTNFAQFSVSPFYNMSRANSNSESLSNASGVLATANLFSAGNFPVTLNIQRSYNSTGRYDTPGSADYTTHGNSDSFGVSWGMRVPRLPQSTFNFSEGNGNYTMYGSSGESHTHFRSFSMSSSYRVSGFDLHGMYSNSTNQNTSNVDMLSANADGASNGHAYGFSASHNIFMHGVLSASVTRNVNNSGATSDRYQSTYDSFTGSAVLAPVRNFTINANYYYTSDLTGSMQQEILDNGGSLSSRDQMKSRGTELNIDAGYVVLPLHLMATVSTDQRSQEVAGHTYTSANYQGSVTYSWYLMGGYFNATTSDFVTEMNNNQSSFGSNNTVTYSRYFFGWGTSASFSYRQNSQTALVTETTNGINYSASVFHKLRHRLHVSSGISGSRSGLAQDASSESRSTSVYATLGNNYGSVTANYSNSNGYVYNTSSGLVSAGDTGTLVDSSLIRYNGRNWGVSLGSGPLPGLVMSVSYSRSLGDTTTSSSVSNNRNIQLNGYVQYQFRRMYINGGYTRMTQAMTGTGITPGTVGSFYVGISRWFNFF